MIAISLSPNTAFDDVLLAFRVLLTPWLWFRGNAIKGLEDWFKRYFNTQFAIAFDSGRSCEYAILRALGIKEGDEVLLQAFTCVAVPNSVLWSGAKPIYVDIDKTGNIDPKDLEQKITEKSKAIIVQHTFGITADIKKLQEIAEKYKLLLIEDCALSLGASFEGKKIGTFGDVAFFSFGRDKVISSVSGGMIITNGKKNALAIRAFQRNLSFPPPFFIFTQLFHPVAFFLILPLYNIMGIGKILLVFLQKLKLLNKPVEEKEKQGGRPNLYPRKLANGQAILALNQTKKLDLFNKKRQTIAALYMQELKSLPVLLPESQPGDIFLRYNILTENADKIRKVFKKRGILLGRWYGSIFDPVGVNLEKIGYIRGSCPNVERWAETSLNLPTYPRMNIKDAQKVVRVLKTFYGKD